MYYRKWLRLFGSFFGSQFLTWFRNPIFFVISIPFAWSVFFYLFLKILNLFRLTEFLSYFLLLADAFFPFLSPLLFTFLYNCLGNELFLPILHPLFSILYLISYPINVIPKHFLFLSPLFLISLCSQFILF